MGQENQIIREESFVFMHLSRVHTDTVQQVKALMRFGLRTPVPTYSRNQYLNVTVQPEELLGIEITPVWGKTSEEIADKINMDKDAGTDDYDAALLSLMEGMNCAQNDAVLNLMDYSAFDETHSWWNQTFVKQCTLFGNQIYTIAGAINIWDDCSNRMMVFNQDILDPL